VADTIVFNEGKTKLAANGLPATCYFLLSSKSVDATSPFVLADTLAAGVGEISGTGYSRKNHAEPTPVNGLVTFVIMTWDTGTATNWSATTRSIVLATTPDNSGKALCAWNLQSGGVARDLSGAHTAESYTPTIQFG